MAYIPNTDADRKKMMDIAGIGNIDELFAQIPDNLKLKGFLDIHGPASEIELAKIAKALSKQNNGTDEFVSFLGAGLYDSYIPATVPAIIGRSEFYTSYTPYQPEISQGNLQSIFEFQTMICQLTGMDVANASMYDGATALAEAAIMASGITGRNKWIISDSIHPSFMETIYTYSEGAGFEIIRIARSGILSNIDDGISKIDENTACVIIQNPNFFGALEQINAIEEYTHKNGALLIISYDPVSLGLLKPPSAYSADICTAEGQMLGIPQYFGGPLLGLFACKKQFIRHMPGRIVGMTTDTTGRRGYTLTLQTREQHIRREKATSNICTNEALYALAAAVYLSTLGPSGLRQAANLSTQKAHYAAKCISELNQFSLPFNVKFFREFVIKTPVPVIDINNKLRENKIVGGVDLGRWYPDLKNHMLLCTTEKRIKDDIDRLIDGLASCV